VYAKCWAFGLRLMPMSFNFVGVVTILVHKFLRVIYKQMFVTMFLEISIPYQTDRYVTDICHSSVKYLQNICVKVSVTYLQHIGIWHNNISVTVMWQYTVISLQIKLSVYYLPNWYVTLLPPSEIYFLHKTISSYFCNITLLQLYLCHVHLKP
jgi:hypothetical protein